MTVSRLGLAVIALLFSVPFLVTDHTSPIPSFHAEWIAAALGLAASLVLVSARRLPLPGAALLALALTGVSLLQAAIGRAPVPPLTFLFGLYLLWAALLACTGRHLAETFGKEKLARILAVAMLAGALLAAVASLLQPWLTAAGWGGFPPRMGGPLGQANQLSSYLWLGLASALYLRASKVLTARMFWTAATLLVLTTVMVGQRSSFAYLAALLGIAAWQARGVVTGPPAEARRHALGIGLLFLVLQPIPLVLPNLYDGSALAPPAMRVAQLAGGPSIRLQLMQLGIEGIRAAPLLGNGIGSYPGLALTHGDALPAEDNPGPAEHAHNLPLDLAAELGLPAALLVLLAAGVWLWRLPQRDALAEVAWAGSVMAILGQYSLIEYPLLFSYFLGLLAVVAGAFGTSRPAGGRLVSGVLLIGVVAWGAVTLAELRRDYRLLETALALGKQPATVSLAQAALLRIPASSLLSPWVNTIACTSLDPLRVSVADGLAVCRIAMVFAPTPESGVNLAVLLWRSGDVPGAKGVLRRMQLASQNNPDTLRVLLAPLIARDASLGDLASGRRRKGA